MARSLAIVCALVCGLLVFSAACGGTEADEENEARLLLDRLDALDEVDLASRSERAQAIVRMPFRSERVVAVRDACGEMHRSMAVAETRGADARRLVEALESAPEPARTPERRAEVEAALGESAEALDRVRELRPTCEEKLGELRTRYPRRN